MTTWVIVAVSAAYLGLLFAVAYTGDRRAAAGRSLINSGSIYALSLAVYATSWTYYGSVGRAASTGVGFLPIYLGPTVMVALGWFVLRKIIRISKRHRITSLADFVSARYGNSTLLGGLVTVIAVVGIVPYIALQLKAVSNTFGILRRYPETVSTADLGHVPLLQDTGLYVALLLAAFTILFGTRHLDASERHEGMVAAIAVESIVKLVAFLAAGIFVTFGIFGGFGDLFGQGAAEPELSALYTLTPEVGYSSWAWLMVLSMLAIVLLPRQWQIAVVENVDERHLTRAVWLFPLYLLVINVFVLPIAIGGRLRFAPGEVDADTFVLALPIAEQQPALALLVFIGGLSAATGMVIVETIALATMVSNSLVMPLLLRSRSVLAQRANLGRVILAIRRVTIVAVLLLGYAYFRGAGEGSALVSIGLVSFAAVAQFAPALLGGLFWRDGTRNGAFAGLLAGFTVWLYTLLLPSLAETGWLPGNFTTDGPFGIALLRPQALFGLDGLDPISHAMVWSTLANVGAYVGVSLAARPGAAERTQSALFVDEGVDTRAWRGTASVADLRALLARFLGAEGAEAALQAYAEERGRSEISADAELIRHVETLLAGAVGTASARILIASVMREEPLGIGEVMEILDEASQVRAYSQELERTSAELRAANAPPDRAGPAQGRLRLDRHPRAAHAAHVDPRVLRDPARQPLAGRGRASAVPADHRRGDRAPDPAHQPGAGPVQTGVRAGGVAGDERRPGRGRARLGGRDQPAVRRQEPRRRDHRAAAAGRRRPRPDRPGAAQPALERRQVLRPASTAGSRCTRGSTARPSGSTSPTTAQGSPSPSRTRSSRSSSRAVSQQGGTGLGLPISRQIIDHLGGSLWVESTPGAGATFSFTLPVAATLGREPSWAAGS